MISIYLSSKKQNRPYLYNESCMHFYSLNVCVFWVVYLSPTVFQAQRSFGFNYIDSAPFGNTLLLFWRMRKMFNIYRILYMLIQSKFINFISFFIFSTIFRKLKVLNFNDKESHVPTIIHPNLTTEWPCKYPLVNLHILDTLLLYHWILHSYSFSTNNLYSSTLKILLSAVIPEQCILEKL